MTQGISRTGTAGNLTFSLTGGFRTHLFEMALNDGKNITFVGSMKNGPATVAGMPFPANHEGHPGWLTYDFLDIIPNPLVSYDPHIVLLEVGMFDMFSTNEADKASDNLIKVVGKIVQTKPNALVVIATVPSNEFPTVGAPAAYNYTVRTLADRSTSDKIILADIDKAEILFPLYPRDSGFKAMADVWYGAIRPYLN